MNARLDGEFREFMHARWPVVVRLAYGLTGKPVSVAAGFAPASAAWVIVNQPDGTTTKVWPVTVGGQKLFAVAVEGGSPNQLSWKDYDSSGAVVGSYPR